MLKTTKSKIVAVIVACLIAVTSITGVLALKGVIGNKED